MTGPGPSGQARSGPVPTSQGRSGPGPTVQGPSGQGPSGQGPSGQGPSGQGPSGQGRQEMPRPQGMPTAAGPPSGPQIPRTGAPGGTRPVPPGAAQQAPPGMTQPVPPGPCVPHTRFPSRFRRPAPRPLGRPPPGRARRTRIRRSAPRPGLAPRPETRNPAAPRGLPGPPLARPALPDRQASPHRPVTRVIPGRRDHPGRSGAAAAPAPLSGAGAGRPPTPAPPGGPGDAASGNRRRLLLLGGIGAAVVIVIVVIVIIATSGSGGGAGPTTPTSHASRAADRFLAPRPAPQSAVPAVPATCEQSPIDGYGMTPCMAALAGPVKGSLSLGCAAVPADKVQDLLHSIVPVAVSGCTGLMSGDLNVVYIQLDTEDHAVQAFDAMASDFKATPEDWSQGGAEWPVPHVDGFGRAARTDRVVLPSSGDRRRDGGGRQVRDGRGNEVVLAEHAVAAGLTRACVRPCGDPGMCSPVLAARVAGSCAPHLIVGCLTRPSCLRSPGMVLGGSLCRRSAEWLAGSIGTVRLTEFRALMESHFGRLRAPSVAMDHVFSELGGRTVDQALAAGFDPKRVWFVVCDTFEVPDRLRYGLPD